MKRLLALFSALLIMASCGVGNYSISSGRADECSLSFSSIRASEITVTVDDTTCRLSSVQHKAYRTDRNIKRTSQNTIWLTPGTHDVKVVQDGQVVFSRTVYISSSEHKVIEL